MLDKTNTLYCRVASVVAILALSACNSTKPSDSDVSKPESDTQVLCLKGKVKTLDIQYYYPRPCYNVDGPTKYAMKDQCHHIRMEFTPEGYLTLETRLDSNENLLAESHYTQLPQGGIMRVDNLYVHKEQEPQSIVYIYDAHRRLVKKEMLYDKGTTLTNFVGEINRYDSLGNIVTHEMFPCSYTNNDLVEYTYDKSGNLQEKRCYSGKERVSYREIYTYNNQGLLVEKIVYTPAPSTKLLEVEAEYQYTYNDKGEQAAVYQFANNHKPVDQITFQYLYYPGKNKPAQMEKHTTETSYSLVVVYDEANKPIARHIDPGKQRVCTDSARYIYDQQGNWITNLAIEPYYITDNCDTETVHTTRTIAYY